MTKLTVIIFTVVALLATVLSPAHAQQPSDTQQLQKEWFVNDYPTLFGPQEWWNSGHAGHGYGSNNYVYTYGIGGESSADNWVHWYMGNRVGRQEIRVYVPSNHATATVNYNIYFGNTQSKVRVEQRNISGWHSLGRFNTNGADVTIAVFDNDVEQHRDRDTPAQSSIGIDAVAMLCVANCSYEESGHIGPPRSVVAVPHGANPLRVTWSAPANSGGSPISGYEVEYSRPALRNHPLYSDRGPYRSGPFKVTKSSHTIPADFTLLNRVTYTVKVVAINEDGQRSEPATTTATTASRSTTAPTRPRSVNAEAYGSQQIRVTWSPPSDSGSSKIKHYIVRYSRPAIGNGEPWSTKAITTDTSHISLNRKYGTTYNITVTAVNRDDLSSKAATTKATTNTRPTTAPTRPRNVNAEAYGSQQIRVTWSPPSDSGSSRIKYYTVRYSRPAIGNGEPWSSSITTTDTSHISGKRRYGTTYTVTVTAVNQDNRVSKPASDTATTRERNPTVRAPRGQPKITSLSELKGSLWFTNDENDVTIDWSTSQVQDASGYYVERRYVSYPTTTVMFNGRGFDIPDLDAKPFVERQPLRKDAGSVSSYQFQDASVEKYKENQNWILQFRIIPYNNAGEGRTSSDWVSLGTTELISAMKGITSCQALDTAIRVHTLGNDIWAAITLSMIVLTGGGSLALAKFVVQQVVGGVVYKSIAASANAIAGCYANQAVDALGDLIPPLGWFMDVTGFGQFLRSLGCHYDVKPLNDDPWGHCRS